MNSSSSELGLMPQLIDSQPIEIPSALRWQVWRRLQELSIPASCLADGRLMVQVDSSVSVAQVRSVVQQFQAKRPDLLDWLERCWIRASEK